jgi:hypothetical protein
MIYLSFNALEVGGFPNILALKILVKSCAPHVIMIQETMCSSSKVVEYFSPWLKDWPFSSLDSDELLEGYLRLGVLISRSHILPPSTLAF